ncbi:MAG: cell division protein FtsZ [Bacteroidales bacterium]|nr:cell division protein FtsZ [Bacteroidales bacterium]MBR5532028.1 cell division protein FtsZ [Bacteroidales bacterium]
MEENRLFSDSAITDPFIGSNNTLTPIIKVIGVGGGGGNAVTHMYKTGIKDVDFVLCNTDRQAMQNSEIPTKVQIGKGLGAGGNPEEGKRIAEENISQIETLFDNNTRMVFITAGMGGGTGTGAAPVVARVAREREILTIGIVTIPFLFERRNKIVQAWKGVEEMRKNVDALLIINNERLREIYPDLNFVNAFAKADDTLTNAAKSVAELITVEGKINLDFADVYNTLRDGGVAIMSTGEGEGERRILNAFENALQSPLLKEGDVNNAKRVLFNIYLSSKGDNVVSMAESAEINTFMERFGNDVDVIWGYTIDDTLGDKVKVTLLATGFNVDSTIPTTSTTQVAQPTVVVRPESDIISEVYGTSAEDRVFMENVRGSYILFSLEEMDDDAFIEKVANTPAYSRPSNFKQQIRETELPNAENGETQPNNNVNPIIF